MAYTGTVIQSVPTYSGSKANKQIHHFTPAKKLLFFYISSSICHAFANIHLNTYYKPTQKCLNPNPIDILKYIDYQLGTPRIIYYEKHPNPTQTKKKYHCYYFCKVIIICTFCEILYFSLIQPTTFKLS